MSRVIVTLNYAAVLGRAGEVAEAAKAQQRALDIARGVAGARGLPPGFAGHLGASLSRLARYDDALVLFNEDLLAARASGNLRSEAVAEQLLGTTLVKMGRTGEARDHLDRAERGLASDRKANARLLTDLALARADLLLRSSRPEEAAATVGAVLADLDYPSRRDAPGIGGALYIAAQVALAQDEPVRAEAYATECLTAATAAARDPRQSAGVGQALLLRAKARRSQGLDGPAGEDAADALVALASGFGPDHPETREARSLADSLARR
jgi:tetratricopeptide (TPR) repeat protein